MNVFSAGDEPGADSVGASVVKAKKVLKRSPHDIGIFRACKGCLGGCGACHVAEVEQKPIFSIKCFDPGEPYLL